MQLLDCAILDVSSLMYQGRALVASAMFLTIGIKGKFFTREEVLSNFRLFSSVIL